MKKITIFGLLLLYAIIGGIFLFNVSLSERDETILLWIFGLLVFVIIGWILRWTVTKAEKENLTMKKIISFGLLLLYVIIGGIFVFNVSSSKRDEAALLLIFGLWVTVIIPVITGWILRWIIKRWMTKFVASSEKKILEEGQKESPSVDLPAPLSKGEDVMTEKQWRNSVKEQFKHVEDLVLKLHKKHEKNQHDEIMRFNRLLSNVNRSFIEAGGKAFNYLIIGIVVSIVVSIVAPFVSGWVISLFFE